MARELLRDWFGLELSAVSLDQLGDTLAEAEAYRLLSRTVAERCASDAAALTDALQGATGAVVHRGVAGLCAVAAPIYGAAGVVGAAVATLARTADSEGELAALLCVTAEEARAVLERTAVLSEQDLLHAKDLVAQAARAASRLAASDPENAGQALASGRHPFLEMIGTAPAILEVTKLVEKVAKSHATALIHGESGTGKELVARAIHYHGPRAKKPFVVQNCSAFNDNLLESALFGHVRGAFTGAVKDQRGLFEAADGGTFFLDEVGDMSAALQVKLLRVLQEGTFTPVGGTKPIKVDVRVVAASHKDLSAMVSRREFREDLFYRLNVLKISLPPLRDRKSDIPLLVRHFLRKHQPANRTLPRMTPAAMAVLMAYPWPGNIRELEHEIERMLVLAGNTDELGPSLISTRIHGGGQAAAPLTVPLADLVRATISQAITAGLVRAAGDREALARDLGVSRPYLEAQCAQLGIDASR
ncbi:MAG: sigma 54-interacting transcriptional regulator [Myxococcales bacterium]|nr:sigma 54-interacting transcriptional regulator [Myxococcales bacterium]